MTNRSKAVKTNNPLRFLDLSFEGRQKANKQEINNGIKPHGGYRGRNKHPLSHLSFDKNHEYHEKLREDIDRLLEEDDLKVHGSPAWVCEANREVSHGGESPLIVNKFLAASRVEAPRSAQSRPRSVRSARNSDVPPPKKEGVIYYRPNRTHQYLTSTDLKDCAQAESNIKYGRPTRTTLLRARQRSNSAPINAYEVRREMLKRAEERKSQSYLKNKKDLLNVYKGYGESQHSWLIGARYNRAHLVDAKTFSLYGMYMPRNNPMGCFVTHSMTNLVKDEEEFGCPSAPPDTPRSDEEGEITLHYPHRVGSAPVTRKLHISSSPPSTKQAWGESATSGAEAVKESEAVIPNGDQKHVPEDGPMNVKGNRLFAPRVESAKRPVLPTVQGVSWRSPRRKDTPEDGRPPTSHPPPPTPLSFATSSQKDFSDIKKLEDLITKRSYSSSRGPPSDKSPSEPAKEDQKLSAPKKIRPILVDRSVNVPSVSGDSVNHGSRVQSARPQSTGFMLGPEYSPQKMDVEQKFEKAPNKSLEDTNLVLDQVEEHVLLDPQAPINSPEGTAHLTSPCSDGKESQNGNDVSVSLSQAVSAGESNGTEKIVDDRVAFFITEKSRGKSEVDASTDGEKELESFSEGENNLQAIDTDRNVCTNNAEKDLKPIDSIGFVSARSDPDVLDNDEDNVLPTPVTQVKVDISKKLDS